MKTRLTFILYFIASIWLLTSCEYNTDEVNYIDINKPDFSNVGINLAGINPDDTIYIYTRTTLSYSIAGVSPKYLEVYPSTDAPSLDINPGWTSNRFVITPSGSVGGNYKLTLNILVRGTGSGSLADLEGLEYYTGTKVYNIKLIPDASFSLNIRETTSPDGYLQLEWDKPNLKQLEVDHYEVSTSYWGEDSYIITDPNQTKYVPENYLYGNVQYYVTTFYKDQKIEPHKEYYTVENYFNSDDLKHEVLDNGQVKLSWKGLKYKCKYIITNGQWSSSKILASLPFGQNSITMSNDFVFPYYNIQYGLIILPADEKDDNFLNYYQSGYLSETISSTDIPSYMQFTDYKVKDKILYGFNYNTIYSVNATNMTVPYQRVISDVWSQMSVSSAPSTNKVLFSAQGTSSAAKNQNLFDDSKFSNKIAAYDMPDVDINYMNMISLIDDNRIAYSKYSVYDASNERYITVVNAQTGSLIYKTKIMDNAAVVISDDKKYVLGYNGRQVQVFELGTASATLKAEYTAPFVLDQPKACSFHPTNSGKLVLSDGGKFMVVDIATKAIDKTVNQKLISIDPFTGNVLCRDKDYDTNNLLSVLDKDMNKVLYQIKVDPYFDFAIYNNYLITTNNYSSNVYYTDITKFPKK